jgi:hypothetical protein
LLQVWFPGDHADVGGGHHEREAGYADTALDWMTQEAVSNGLQLNSKVYLHFTRKLHQQSMWFIINTPLIRPEIRELARFYGPEWNHASYCHSSVDAHLNDYKIRGYKFFHKGLNSALNSVDYIAMDLMAKAKKRKLIV